MPWETSTSTLDSTSSGKTTNLLDLKQHHYSNQVVAISRSRNQSFLTYTMAQLKDLSQSLNLMSLIGSHQVLSKSWYLTKKTCMKIKKTWSGKITSKDVTSSYSSTDLTPQQLGSMVLSIVKNKHSAVNMTSPTNLNNIKGHLLMVLSK